MGGQVGGSNSGNKAGGGTTTNTGQPNWMSGATANNAVGTGWNSMGSAGPQPGTDAYNSMNTQLQTSPMQSLVNLFQQGGLGNVSSGVMNNLANSTGSNNAMNSAMDQFNQLGTTGTQNFQNLYNQAGTPGAQENYLTQFANGSQVMNNPYLQGIIQQGQDEAATGINQQFSAAGRYGSPTNYGTIADSYQNVGNKFRGEQLNNDLNRQLQAAQGISQEQLGRMGIQSGAAQGVGGLQQAGASGLGSLGSSAMSNWLNSQNAASNIQNQGVQNMLSGMGQLGNVQQNKMFDSAQQRGVGQEVDQASQQQLNDLINQWTQGDMSEWARLGGLTSAGTSTAGNWGTQSGSTTQKQNAGIGSILGGLLSIL